MNTDPDEETLYWRLMIAPALLILVGTARVESIWLTFLLAAALSACASRLTWWLASERTAWFRRGKAGGGES